MKKIFLLAGTLFFIGTVANAQWAGEKKTKRRL